MKNLWQVQVIPLLLHFDSAGPDDLQTLSHHCSITPSFIELSQAHSGPLNGAYAVRTSVMSKSRSGRRQQPRAGITWKNNPTSLCTIVNASAGSPALPFWAVLSLSAIYQVQSILLRTLHLSSRASQ